MKDKLLWVMTIILLVSLVIVPPLAAILTMRQHQSESMTTACDKACRAVEDCERIHGTWAKLAGKYDSDEETCTCEGDGGDNRRLW